MLGPDLDDKNLDLKPEPNATRAVYLGVHSRDKRVLLVGRT